MVVVYSKSNCPACEQVKNMLTSRGVAFVTKSAEDPSVRSWLIAQGHRSVPQVYEEDRLIGGVGAVETMLSQQVAEAVS